MFIYYSDVMVVNLMDCKVLIELVLQSM